uniref:Uncharacterized protein n=1 Tax=Mucochytrium quahogii TaxID=96639 RepID=A0A7S2SAX3_9STRA
MYPLPTQFRLPQPRMKRIIYVRGWEGCPFHQKCTFAAADAVEKPGSNMEMDLHTFPAKNAFDEWMENERQANLEGLGAAMAPSHKTSPAVWIKGEELAFIGGCTEFIAWAAEHFPPEEYKSPDICIGRGNWTDDRVVERLSMHMNNTEMTKVTPEQFSKSHPLFHKMLTGEPYNITKDSTAKDGTLYPLQGEATTLFEVLEDYAGKLVLLNFGSYS